MSPRVELKPQIMASDSLELPVKIFFNSVSSLLSIVLVLLLTSSVSLSVFCV